MLASNRSIKAVLVFITIIVMDAIKHIGTVSNDFTHLLFLFSPHSAAFVLFFCAFFISTIYYTMESIYFNLLIEYRSRRTKKN